MAFVEWDVTSLTTGRDIAAEKAVGFYFGTLHGVAGYWVRIPEHAPAIGSITLIGVNEGMPDGVILKYGQTSDPIMYDDIARTIVGYEKGGRWIDLGTSTPTAPMAAGSARKKIALYYKSVNEYSGPTA